jgi:hypothetical protein
VQTKDRAAAAERRDMIKYFKSADNETLRSYMVYDVYVYCFWKKLLKIAVFGMLHCVVRRY